MVEVSRLVEVDSPTVAKSLRDAGWFEGRETDISGWVRSLEATGFELNDLALRVWREFGGLKIKSSEIRTPASSLWIDPEDACVDSADEASKLRQRFGENYSPLGMWSVQFRSYISAGGRVVAIGLLDMWELGSSFSEAVNYVVNGGSGENRLQQADWLS
ncbi:SUKH-3 domain-containing protein [Streptomyces lushanensis]|uniref:SUKH-3 domain-containing protein n=1 Tax=Streptomyces lushanensis TaxID=1434255 RepID=UPI00099FBA56|nr:SUKH-3 domain-containing protein [Streptomyces lushanensis]